MDQNQKMKVEEKKTFTDFLRIRFKRIADSAAGFLLNIGLTPNTITIFGLIGHFVAAGLIIKGHIVIGGGVLLIMAPMDFLDGSMARKKGNPNIFGAFLDSVTDRYSEFIILGGLLIYYSMKGNLVICVGVYLAAMGSIMVSYIRSKAEGLGFQVKIGLLTRVERYIILVPGLLFNIAPIAIWLIAIFANFTALQRIHFVFREAYHQKNEQLPN